MLARKKLFFVFDRKFMSRPPRFQKNHSRGSRELYYLGERSCCFLLPHRLEIRPLSPVKIPDQGLEGKKPFVWRTRKMCSGKGDFEGQQTKKTNASMVCLLLTTAINNPPKKKKKKKCRPTNIGWSQKSRAGWRRNPFTIHSSPSVFPPPKNAK